MSKFILKTFEAEKHFAEVSTWWKFWRLTKHPTPEILSDKGFIVESEGANICAGWLYTTNSVISSMQFVVANPFAKGALRSKALSFLFKEIERINRQEGGSILMAHIKSTSLNAHLFKSGFVPGDVGLQQFVKVGG